MPKKLAPDLLDHLEAEVRRHPDGVAVAHMVQLFEQQASRRSLTRLLDRLVRRKRIRVEGEKRGTLYFPATSIQGALHATLEPLTLKAEGEVYVPLTGESSMLRDWVRRPITERQPVSYDRTLLDSYEPNRTFYLTNTDWRVRLREIGRTSLTARPAGTYARDILNRLLIDLSWASSHLEGNT